MGQIEWILWRGSVYTWLWFKVRLRHKKPYFIKKTVIIVSLKLKEKFKCIDRISKPTLKFLRDLHIVSRIFETKNTCTAWWENIYHKDILGNGKWKHPFVNLLDSPYPALFMLISLETPRFKWIKSNFVCDVATKIVQCNEQQKYY